MIELREKDIFGEGDIKVIAHQANLFHTMGHGIAAIIKKRYPEAYIADLETPYGDETKLGTYSVSKQTALDGKHIVNVYSQQGIGGNNRNTRYDAVTDAFERLEKSLRKKITTRPDYILGVPYGYGSVLGGGRWPIVASILHTIFDKSPVQLIVCRLPNQVDLE